MSVCKSRERESSATFTTMVSSTDITEPRTVTNPIRRSAGSQRSLLGREPERERSVLTLTRALPVVPSRSGRPTHVHLRAQFTRDDGRPPAHVLTEFYQPPAGHSFGEARGDQRQRSS